LKALANLLMREVFASLQRFFAKVDRFNEAVFLVEMPRNDFLYQFVGVTALLSGRQCEFRFEFRCKVHLHVFRLREKWCSGKASQVAEYEAGRRDLADLIN
jgi:hypothetical protein